MLYPMGHQHHDLRQHNTPVYSICSHAYNDYNLENRAAIYRVQLASFSNVCGELEEGNVEAKAANVFGTSTVLVPILSYQTSAN